MLKHISKFALALALIMIIPGAALAGDITVSAAASLTNALAEIKQAFENRYPKIRVQTNFASSNQLLKQIETGAPVDVFASADQATMNQGEKLNLMDKKTRKDFAANTLTLIVPAGESKDITTAADLVRAKHEKVAIGNPESVPVGRYTREVLTENKLFDALREKYIMGENVRQILDYVVRGEVDAGFVYGTDARLAGDKVRVVETLTGNTPVLYPIAVVDASRDKTEAQLFIDFVLSAEGQAILSRYGFHKPSRN